MNATAQFHRNLPHYGARSESYFGIKMMFDPLFFHLTSSYGIKNRTRHPSLVAFRRYEKQQINTRNALWASKGMADSSHVERVNEWRSIIHDVSLFATEKFLMMSGLSVSDIVTFNAYNSATLLDVADHAFLELERQVKIRMVRNGGRHLSTEATIPLPFISDNQPRIYVYMQRLHSKETPGCKCYKIGHTKNEVEDRGHRGSNNDIELVTVIPEDSTVTEVAIHRLFNAKRMRGERSREWFMLSENERSLLLSPERLRNQINTTP